MKYQQGTNQSYGKSAHYLTERMVLQDNPCRAQYTCYENEYTQPAHRIVSEQGTESNQPTYYGTGSRHVFAEFPFQVDNDTDNHHDKRGKDNSCHIPGNVQPVHHEQAEHIGSDSQDERHISPFPFR